MTKEIHTKKRRREPRTVDTELIEIYEDLANESEEIRLEAAKNLLAKLPSLSSEQRHRVLGRLFRGLCSGRKAARLGFSVAVTEVLTQLAETSDRPVDVENLAFLVTLEEETVQPPGLSSSEQRDYYLGKLFGAEAIIKSGVLFATGSDVKHWERALKIICAIAKKKSQLREECGWILHEAITLLAAQRIASEYAEILLRLLCADGLEKTPEGLAVWITASRLFPDFERPKNVWRHGDPLSRAEVSKVANVLKEGSNADLPKADMAITQKGGWNPKIHFAWHIVFACLLEMEALDSKRSSRRFKFSDLWTEVVDNMLFAGKATNERKYWGFMLFQYYVQKVPSSILHDLFRKNFLRCLVNQLASSERYLHRAAEKCLEALDSRAKSEPTVVPLVIAEIMDSNGYADFDSLTKTKTIEKLLTRVDPSKLRDFVLLFVRVIADIKTTDEKTADIKRQAVASHLVTIIKLTANQDGPDSAALDSDSCIKDILKAFAQFVYYIPRESSHATFSALKPPLSPACREMFRQKLMSSLTFLMTKGKDRAVYPFLVVSCVQNKKEEAMDSPTYQFDDNVTKDVDEAWKTLSKIHKKAKKADGIQEGYLSAICLLYSLTIIQVYNSETEALGLLDDIRLCYNGFTKQSADKDVGDASELLMEVLLSLISKASLLSRRLAEQVFSSCTAFLKAEGLRALVKVLQTSESVAGQAEIFEHVDDELNSSGDDYVEKMSMDGDASDVSMLSGDSDGSDSSESGSGESEASDETDEELAAFDAKLAQALGTRRADEDLAASDVEGSSDEDMNDEQMEALDEHLEKIFQEKEKLKSKKNEKKDAKETVIAFKSRVIELLEIYIKQQYRNPLALELILPLLELIRKTSSKQVSEKACTLVREFLKLYKLQNEDEKLAKSHLVALRHLLTIIHADAAREGSNAYGTACSNASILVCKVLMSNGEAVETITQLYASTQGRFLADPNSKVRPAFFSDWLNWCASARNQLSKWGLQQQIMVE